MDYDSMPLLNAFIKETLRLYPAAPYLEHAAEKDMVIPLTEEIHRVWTADCATAGSKRPVRRCYYCFVSKIGITLGRRCA
ncbi:hypothetical protein FB45DRAFT_945655 [Roridomyces roridus]|uniref:Uncharacterized protein n=1 Tax=Roridomyces roridus TaxID=1738132 RepID=A0AAD7B2B4_9AGAR|nr:hypothetical protein FB45DRAFT_945655 [Roridomyces roridus]